MQTNTLDPSLNFRVRFAVTRAIGPKASIGMPQPGQTYKGDALLVNDDYLVQQIGDQAIAHRRDSLGNLPLDDDDIKRPYKLQGAPLSIKYDDAGRGAVAFDFDALQRKSERMDAIEEDYRRAFAPEPSAGNDKDVSELSGREIADLSDAELQERSRRDQEKRDAVTGEKSRKSFLDDMSDAEFEAYQAAAVKRAEERREQRTTQTARPDRLAAMMDQASKRIGEAKSQQARTGATAPAPAPGVDL